MKHQKLAGARSRRCATDRDISATCRPKGELQERARKTAGERAQRYLSHHGSARVRLNKQKKLPIRRTENRALTTTRASGQGHQVHSDLGEGGRRAGAGLGTMIGWKRIVVTVGEKIGKEHLTYAQGASAELVAMATIWRRITRPAGQYHARARSGVAGTMAANKSGLQMSTIRNIAARGSSRCRRRRCCRGAVSAVPPDFE